jgi:catalase
MEGPSWEPLHERILDAVAEVYGRHPGKRALHAKGTLCAGTFVAEPAAAALTKAAHLQGDEVRVTVRFSNGSGDPEARDGSQDGRGMATKFYLPEGDTTDIVAISRTAFFVRTPEDFLGFMEARRPDPETGQPDMEKLGAWLGDHPEAGPAVQEQLAAKPPESYGRVTYYSIHAYRFTSADGEERWVRYRWEPDAGEADLSDEEAAEKSRDYLHEEIRERLAEGPVAFRLFAQIGEEGDDPTDPTVAWPDEREQVELGRLELTGLDEVRERDGDICVFDPMRVTDGIEPSEDRILHARRPSYAVSVDRRSNS